MLTQMGGVPMAREPPPFPRLTGQMEALVSQSLAESLCREGRGEPGQILPLPLPLSPPAPPIGLTTCSRKAREPAMGHGAE